VPLGKIETQDQKEQPGHPAGLFLLEIGHNKSFEWNILAVSNLFAIAWRSLSCLSPIK
jgi:hypothetical protein